MLNCLILVLVFFKSLAIRDLYNGWWHKQKIPLLQDILLFKRNYLTCIQVEPVSLIWSTKNEAAGRSAEAHGTTHKRKAKSLFIVFAPQKAPVSLCEWAESLPMPPERDVLSPILGCTAQMPSHHGRCGWQQDRPWHTETWVKSFSLGGQDLGWSQSLRLAGDAFMAGKILET